MLAVMNLLNNIKEYLSEQVDGLSCGSWGDRGGRMAYRGGTPTVVGKKYKKPLAP